MTHLVQYSKDRMTAWNEFLEHSNNGLFLFNRSYMDYHADRFNDSSIMVSNDGGQLLALFPASVKNDVVTSHAGLTFGGFIVDFEMRASLMMSITQQVFQHFEDQGIRRIVYKAIPHIYHTVPAEDDLYALFRMNARLVRRDLSSTILMSERSQFTKERRWSVRKSQSNKVAVRPSDEYASFMKIEEENLKTKHGTKPVHTAAEIELLASRFPDNIRLFVAEMDGEMTGGVIVYESRNVAHLQYLASTAEGRRICAVDAIVDYLLNQHYISKRYFDFGISTEEGGRFLNQGLCDYKCGFGAHAVVYDTYEIDLEEGKSA